MEVCEFSLKNEVIFVCLRWKKSKKNLDNGVSLCYHFSILKYTFKEKSFL